MSSVVDLWRAIDPDARLASGSVDALTRPVRGVLRTRAAPPHLPPAADGQLLLVDAGVVDARRGGILTDALTDAGLAPSAVLVAGIDRPATTEPGEAELPLLVSSLGIATLERAAIAYLEDETGNLAAFGLSLRLATAEAALADPQPGAAAGEVAARLRRGVAVSVDGRLRALNPRLHGRALAARFAATFERLLASASAESAAPRRVVDGLWILGRPIGPGSVAWFFDDVPFARIDEAALDALSVTLRALLRRPVVDAVADRPPRREPPSSGDALRDTLMAVARANGRVSVAARALGVHRNTVLYRLRRARAEQGIDPRRPEDALRLLREADRDDR